MEIRTRMAANGVETREMENGIGNKCAMKDTGKETNHPVPDNDILCGAWEFAHMFCTYRFVLEYSTRICSQIYIHISTATRINEFNLTFSKIHT